MAELFEERFCELGRNQKEITLFKKEMTDHRHTAQVPALNKGRHLAEQVVKSPEGHTEVLEVVFVVNFSSRIPHPGRQVFNVCVFNVSR